MKFYGKYALLIVLQMAYPVLGMQDSVNCLNLPKELVHSITDYTIDPYATLEEAAQQLALLSKANKQINDMLYKKRMRFKELNIKVKEYVAKVYSIESNSLLLIQEKGITDDAHALQSVAHALSEKTQNSKLEVTTWVVTAFTLNNYYPLKKLIGEKNKGAEDILYRNVLRLRTLQTRNNTYDYNQTVDEIITLLQHGVNPNAVCLHKEDEGEVRIFQVLCDYGRVNYKLLNAFIDTGVSWDCVYQKEDHLLYYLCCDAWSNKTLSCQERQLLIQKMLDKNLSTINEVNDHCTVLDMANLCFNSHEGGRDFIDFLRSQGAKTYQRILDEDL